MDWVERFKSKFIVDLTSGCWFWNGTFDAEGYSLFWLHGQNRRAQRVAYELYRGQIPENHHLDHYRMNQGPRHASCARHCVSPWHLEPVTPRENTIRGNSPRLTAARQLAKTHCPKGHPYAGDNLVVYKVGRRECRECRRRIARESQRRRRAGIKVDA